MSISEIHKKYAALSAARGTAIGPAPGAQLSGAAAENQAPSRSRPPLPRNKPYATKPRACIRREPSSRQVPHPHVSILQLIPPGDTSLDVSGEIEEGA